MCPIVSACGMATYQLAKFLTKILQRYTGITPSFVKDSKNFSEHLRSVHISEDEELVSFDVLALFTGIPVPTALDVINHLFCEHIEDPEAKHKYGCSFECNTIGLKKDEVMQLLNLLLLAKLPVLVYSMNLNQVSCSKETYLYIYPISYHNTSL